MTQSELEKKILDAQDAYYNSGEPIMSDEDFDYLWDELKTRYPDSRVLQMVGSDNANGFPKVKHDIIMGSQAKANREDEMSDFFGRNKKGKFVAQEKMDGLSLALYYVGGKLVQGVTRGDGSMGSDVTSNVRKMNFVPKQIDPSFTGCVRGEMLLSRANHKKFFSDMKNCRNAASGISKHLDGSDCDKLDVVCYDAQYKDGSSFGTQTALMEWLIENGFKVAAYEVLDMPSGKDAMEFLKRKFDDFDNLEYDIDGIVWKQDAIDMNDIKTNYRPKSMIALKPSRRFAMTELLDIKWQVINGTITPIAQLKPVDMAGATVRQASLANVRQMELLDIEIGDTVQITRAGEIIPKITKNVTKDKELEYYAE